MNIILGHMIGDYLLQSDWMVINKKLKGTKGFLACVIHCLIWATSVYVFGFLNSKSLVVFLLLFLSHYILDRTNFVKWYCNASRIMPNPSVWKIIIVDNTLHLLMIYFIKLLVI